MAPNDGPRVGIVVIGRNEGERLVLALRSVSPEKNPVVYVDSNSSDDSVANAQRAGAHVVDLDMTKPFSAARARNAGFQALTQKHGSLDFVQFMDGDCELDPRWLAQATLFLNDHPDVALVCGRRRERYPERSIYNQLCDIEWNTPVGEAEDCGGDFLVRPQPFVQVGGFRDQLIAGEELELCARLRQANWRIWRMDAEMTLHDANMTRAWQAWRRSVRCGFAFASLAYLHGRGVDRLKGRQVMSALIWGALIPAGILVATAIYWPLVALFAIYPLQAIRVGLQSGYPVKAGLLYGSFVTAAKFAECIGIAKLCLANLRGRDQALIEYK